MPKKTTSGAPKKARWSTAQKASATKKPHRGQSGPSGGSRPYAGGSADRGPRQGGFDRPQRDDRPARDDRAPRSDRPSYDRPRTNDRPARDDRAPRSDRPSYERPRTNDRPSYARPNRDDRPARDDRAPRGDRPSYERPRTNDRPSYARPNRDDRPARDDRAPRGDRPTYARPNRDDRAPRGDRPSYERPRANDRPSYDRPRTNDRPVRDDTWNRKGNNASWEREDRIGHDAEAERIEADTWTKASRASVTGPVEVAEDNGFAALGLPERLVERLAREGITTPFPIQVATIPDALAGRDVLGRGQTGSGKTLAFGLPTLTRLVNDGPTSAPRLPRALVLVPTRELAMQVSDALEPLVHVMGLKHKLVAGGLSYTTQLSALNRGVDLLIATPGRLNDLLERGALQLDAIQVVILDEADHMADMGFMPEITAILDRIPAGGQRLLFSATLDKGVDGLVKSYLTDAVTHSTDDAKASVTTMEHHVLLIDPMHKKVITAEVANRVGRTVVFVRTKLGADRVAQQLREQGVMAAALHGGLNQGARNRVLGAFRDGSLPVLVATDVAARGIHVDDVSVVLQVDPPADHKDYLHRSGRTARAGDKGTVVTLALPHQRKGMERQLRDAGVDAVPTKAIPGDAVLAAAGASTPSGIPVPEEAFRRLLEGEQKRRAPGGSRGPRHGAKGGFRPHHGGPRRAGGQDRAPRREARA